MAGSCVVAFCKNIGTRLFPTDETRRAQWIEAIEHVKPGFTIRKYSRICSAHFKTSDLSRTPLSSSQIDGARKIFKKTAVPSIFPWKKAPQESPSQDDFDTPCFNTTKTQKTFTRVPQLAFIEEMPYHIHLTEPEASENIDPLQITADQEIVTSDAFETDCSSSQLHIDIINNDSLGSEVIEEDKENVISNDNARTCEIIKAEKCVQVNISNKNSFSINTYKDNDKAIHFYTGLETYDKLCLVFQTLGESACHLKYIYGNPPKTLSPLEQFFLVLIIFRRSKAFEEISMDYLIPIKQVYNIFITWVRFMAIQWRKLDLWLDKNIVHAYAPTDFYDKYPSTRIILDATEVPVKKPKLPLAQQITFSSYKNRNTVKTLIGIAPSGLITYVSPCYGGSATDRQIIERSSILNRFDWNDEIMVDKGLNIQDILIGYGVKINMPSFFKKGNQINPDTLSSNRKVASKRVHVERIIGMLKTYKILTQPLNQTQTLLSSDIVLICAMFVNFRSDIINKNA